MNPPPGQEYWVICPICHKVNPLGLMYCKHCWGAAIRDEKPVTANEAKELLEQFRKEVFHHKIKREP